MSAHVPVLLAEVVDALDPKPGETHVDGTFGAGGYSCALLDRGARVIAFDRDPDALYEASHLEVEYEGRLSLFPQRFSEMASVLERISAGLVDGVTLDIGVSSMQIDRAERGFSFQSDGPLDMRMSQSGESAADFLNSAAEADIADVIYRYGEEPKSRRIARAIVAARPLETTGQLARVVRAALSWRAHEKKDPAIRVFQAIRIHINAELKELEDGLVAAEQVLAPGGRLAVVTFHSLEDRLVKNFLRERSGANASGSRHLPQQVETRSASFSHVAKPVRAGEAELAANPRARSATLRSARRTAAEPWPAIGGQS